MNGEPGYLAVMFGISLGLTLAIELAAVYLYLRFVLKEAYDRSRMKSMVFLVVLVNLLTNPPAVLVCWLGSLYLPLSMGFPLELAVEGTVIAGEGMIYRSFAGQSGGQIPGPFFLSAAANLSSWLAGRLL